MRRLSWQLLRELLASLAVGAVLAATVVIVADSLSEGAWLRAAVYAAAGLLPAAAWLLAFARWEVGRRLGIGRELAAELHAAAAALPAGTSLVDSDGGVLLRVVTQDRRPGSWLIYRITVDAAAAAVDAVAGEPLPRMVVIPEEVFLVRGQRLVRLDSTIPLRFEADGWELVDLPALNRRQIAATVRLQDRLGQRWTPPPPAVEELIGQLRRAQPVEPDTD